MDNKIFKLAYDGLLQLGFKDKEIKESFMKIKDENMSVEDIISFVLKDRSKWKTTLMKDMSPMS